MIAPDIVLAAGHCKSSQPRAHARVGTYSFRKDVEGVDSDTIRISKQLQHPAFEWAGDDEFIHDFLLIKLKYASHKPPIRLNRHAHVPAVNEEVVVMGVGNTDRDYESKSDVLMVATLNAIANEICVQSFDDDRNLTYAGRIHPSMMCTTGGPNNERDAWCVTCRN